MSTINGRELQHSLVTLAATCPVTGAPQFTFKYFKSVTCKDGAKKEPVRDKNGQITGYTIAQQETDGEIVTLLSEMLRFETWLRQQATLIAQQIQQPCGPGQVEFALTINYGNVPSKLITRQLGTVLVQEEAFDSKDDQKALETKIPLFVIGIADNNNQRFIEYPQ